MSVTRFAAPEAVEVDAELTPIAGHAAPIILEAMGS